MNKLLYLINVDLRRSNKFYIAYISFFSLITLSLNLFEINKFKNSKFIMNLAIGDFGGIFYGIGILSNLGFIQSILFFGMLGLFIYYIFMWKREFFSNNQSIYTLMMLPQNKFKICISKSIALITMIYGFLISQIATLFICKYIFNFIFRNMPIIKMNFAKDLYYLNLKSIPIDFISFMAIYVFLLLIAISIVNCCILFIFSYINKIYVILITLLIIAGLYFSTVYINIITLFRKYYKVIGFQFNNLVAGLLSFLIIMFILNGISYLLIKKKVSL
ncbi:ABC transporter permease [Clostridioides difficile]|uniref:ABC transporter permease n=1 Tax=Clostridioides difficile TaxID=1496 RepID=UPI00097FFB64|nr:ABC transporter permease [Clostridioides difficile]MBY2230970.1 ABC transporter permease [Clostridioides difficile]MCU5873919.1 ABC transporter permease [Clostridioides difficile]MCU5899838.1 ABC transporter permease [Clostridioides difficile]MCV2271392.1 ABC transporter permease [Clostridioides difficile]MDV9710238.1 ABC transporter permease [Clostridioides difficile]